MKFVNQSDSGSLDSGDAIDCIRAGIETITAALVTLRADCEQSKTSSETFAATIAALEDWKRNAQALLDYTEPDEDEDDDEEGVDTLDFEDDSGPGHDH